MSTLRLPGINIGACSACLPCTILGSGPAGRHGQALTGASRPRLQRRGLRRELSRTLSAVERVNVKKGSELTHKNVTRSMTKKGSLTHNGCYRIKGPQRTADYESAIKKRIYEAILLRYKNAPYNQRTIVLDEFSAKPLSRM
jgi:hypothetical protein